MQIVRTVVWVLIIVALALFAVANWVPIDVRIWENLVLETKLPVLIAAAFLLGLLPMWLLHRTQRWRLERKVNALEASQRALVANQAETTHHATRDETFTDTARS